jgi:protein TonB
MFENALILPESRFKSSFWALPLSAAAHAVAAGILIVLPLLRPAAPPPFRMTGAFLAPARVLPLPPPPPPGRASAAKKGTRIAPVQARPNLVSAALVAPVEIPRGIEDELIPGLGLDGGVPGGVPGGVEGSFLDGLYGNILDIVSNDVQAPLPAIGEIRPPRLIKRIDPVYPELGRESRTEGTVIIEAETDIYGRVSALRVLRSVPLLDEAALAAVRQWVYEPIVVNGRPRGVVFTVTVRFVLK